MVRTSLVYVPILIILIIGYCAISTHADINYKLIDNKGNIVLTDSKFIGVQSGGYNFWSQAVNTSANSNYLVSGDFWKIREASLSYNLPTSLFGFAKGTVKGATFTVSGRNLFMFLPKSNQWTDPEFSNTVGNAQGVSGLDNTPPTRIFGATLNIQF